MNIKPTLQIVRQSWHAWLGSDPNPPGPAWLKFVWMALFCGGCAVFFTLLGYALDDNRTRWSSLSGWWYRYQVSVVVTLCIGICIRTLFTLGRRILGVARIENLSGLPRVLYFNLVPIAGVLVGWMAGVALTGQKVSMWDVVSDPQSMVASALFTVSITAVFFLVFGAQARRLKAEKSAAEARLRLLQGQVEPHFLFNTLANVVSLIDYDAPRAKLMLETFTDYLRASLTSLRQDQATLLGELQMVEHYLDLMKVRMEERLNFSIDCDQLVRDAQLPPLLLQPLVENAIHHGLEPQVDGGTIRITARLDRSDLVLEVADDGLGLNHSARRPGAGMALGNLRERLQTKYGANASLTLQAANPGTRVTLRLPYLKDSSA